MLLNKAHCKELLCQHHGSPRESPTTLSSWQVWRVGKGPESRAPHPGSSAPPSRSNPIHPQKHAPPHKPTPAHWPHRCSPTQTDPQRNKRGSLIFGLALSCQTENRHRDVPCLQQATPADVESRSLGSLVWDLQASRKAQRQSCHSGTLQQKVRLTQS